MTPLPPHAAFLSSCRGMTVAFSGGGHLLPYHLGVALTLWRHQAKSKGQLHLPPLRATSGSSSGAIAAALLAKFPHRIEDYANQFLKDRGKAFTNFRHVLKDEEKQARKMIPENEVQQQDQTMQQSSLLSSSPSSSSQQSCLSSSDLYVCVTRSEDGLPHLLPFSSSRSHSFLNNNFCANDLIRAIEASCKIPVSFHPLDLFQKSPMTYPDEGISIDEKLYVDGGMSGIFPPPLPLDLDGKQPSLRLLVCPLALKSVSSEATNDCSTKTHVISPGFQSHSSSRSWSESWMMTRDQVSLLPNYQNMQSLVEAGGFASSENLKSWYSRGIEDAEQMASQFCDK